MRPTSLTHRFIGLLVLYVAVTTPVHAQADAQPPPQAAESADQLRAAWVSPDKRSIYSATRAKPAAQWAAPNRVLTTRGSVGKIAFAPNGNSIAFENLRTWLDDGTANDRWGFIGVYDFQTRQISYVDPSFNIDTDPVWSADSSNITFTRQREGLRICA